jgi:phenylalanyl-tRNA synthetase beta chain
VRILLEHLRRYVALPEDPRTVRDLLEDVGIEVKRSHTTPEGIAFTVELLANRGDHHCYAGIAREIGGRTGGVVWLPPVTPLRVGAGPVPVHLETAACLVYTVTELRAGGGGPGLPAELLAPLAQEDVVVTGSPVDATNLANLEIGQPTHTFDADAVEGGIVVRPSLPGERAQPLFSDEPVELPAGTIVIADHGKILAIAGVIGCQAAKVTPSTTRILLESATFDPVEVRKASRALGLFTSAASRFMRGGDPTLPLTGAGRVAWCLQQYLGWRVHGDTGRAGDWTDPGRTVPLDVAAAERFVGYPMTPDEVAERLARYGFHAVADPEAGAGTLLVRVPPHRLWDVEFPADLYEELAKSIGFNVTEVALPSVDIGSLPTGAERLRAEVDELVTGEGFYELFTDGFYSRGDRDRLGITEQHPLWRHVEVLNAVDRRYSLLKNNCLVQAVDAVATNINVMNLQVKAYEWTRTFHPPAPEQGAMPEEREMLWLVVNGRDRAPRWDDDGRPADVFYLKGLVEKLRIARRLDFELAPPRQHPLRQFLHPARSAEITLDGRTIGVLGELHPSVLQRFRIKRERPCYLELEVAALARPGRPRVYEAAPAQLPIVRDLSISMPFGITAGEIAGVIRSAAGPELDSIEVTDVFELTDERPRLRVVTYQLTFRQDRSPQPLSRERVNELTAGLVDAVRLAYGARGVALRGEEAVATGPDGG